MGREDAGGTLRDEGKNEAFAQHRENPEASDG